MLSSRDMWNEKRQKPSLMRTKIKSLEKNPPMKGHFYDDPKRVQETIMSTTQGSLKETFNLKLYKSPVWKSVEKNKWLNQTGFSYEGQRNYTSRSINTALDLALQAHKVDGTRTQTYWNVLKNEDASGKNPYAGGFNLLGAEMTSRKRNIDKEKQVSKIPFNSTNKRSSLADDKSQIKTLNSFLSLEKSYRMKKQQYYSDAGFMP